jgi:hypothetical protein
MRISDCRIGKHSTLNIELKIGSRGSAFAKVAARQALASPFVTFVLFCGRSNLRSSVTSVSC